MLLSRLPEEVLHLLGRPGYLQQNRRGFQLRAVPSKTFCQGGRQAELQQPCHRRLVTAYKSCTVYNLRILHTTNLYGDSTALMNLHGPLC